MEGGPSDSFHSCADSFATAVTDHGAETDSSVFTRVCISCFSLSAAIVQQLRVKGHTWQVVLRTVSGDNASSTSLTLPGEARPVDFAIPQALPLYAEVKDAKLTIRLVASFSCKQTTDQPGGALVAKASARMPLSSLKTARSSGNALVVQVVFSSKQPRTGNWTPVGTATLNVAIGRQRLSASGKTPSSRSSTSELVGLSVGPFSVMEDPSQMDSFDDDEYSALSTSSRKSATRQEALLRDVSVETKLLH